MKIAQSGPLPDILIFYSGGVSWSVQPGLDNTEAFMAIYRIPQLIQTLIRVSGNVNALHRDLFEITKVVINQPKLRRLSSDTVGQESLSGTELQALDKLVAHFRATGRTDWGLRGLVEFPIFGHLGVMEAIESSGKPLLFALGTRCSASDGQPVHDVRSWDCRAMGQVLLAIGGLHDIHVRFADCFPSRTLKELQRQTWFEEAEKDKASIVSIGSVHACAATEWLLSRMFGLDSFARGTPASKLPFYFIWSPRITNLGRSSTSLSHESLPSSAAPFAKRVKLDTAWGLKIGEQFYSVLKNETDQLTFGLFAAQRQSDGRVFIAISGITGPATFAVAKMLERVNVELPTRPAKEQRAPVLWGAVQALVTTAPRQTGVPGSTVVGEPEWLSAPTIWEPK